MAQTLDPVIPKLTLNKRNLKLASNSSATDVPISKPGTTTDLRVASDEGGFSRTGEVYLVGLLVSDQLWLTTG